MRMRLQSRFACLHRRLSLVRGLPACSSACTSGPATDRALSLKRVRGRSARKDAFMREARSPRFRQTSATRSCRCEYFPVDLSFSRAGVALTWPTSGRCSRCRRPPARSHDTTRRSPAVHAEGTTADALGAFVPEGTQRDLGAVRAVRRRNQRYGDVCRGPIPGSPADITGLYTDRFQQRLQPLLRLQRQPTSARIPPPTNRLKVPVRPARRRPARDHVAAGHRLRFRRRHRRQRATASHGRFSRTLGENRHRAERG